MDHNVTEFIFMIFIMTILYRNLVMRSLTRDQILHSIQNWTTRFQENYIKTFYQKIVKFGENHKEILDFSTEKKFQKLPERGRLFNSIANIRNILIYRNKECAHRSHCLKILLEKWSHNYLLLYLRWLWPYQNALYW